MTTERTFRMALLLLLLAAAATRAAPAAPEGDLERTVQEQGRQIRDLKAEVERLRAQETTRDRGALAEDIERYLDQAGPDSALSAGAERPGLLGRTRLGGYFSLEFYDGEGEPTTFDQHRLVLLLYSQIADGIRFSTEIEFEGGGADVDFLTDNEILVEYAELGFDLIGDHLAFVAGIILMPWGRYNQIHDDPLWNLTERPLVARYIGAVAFGQPGLALEGTVEPADGWFLDYDVALVQGFAEGFSTNGGVRGARQSFREDNNNNKQVFGRIVVSPPVRFLDALEAGGSFNFGNYDAAGSLSTWGYAFEIFAKRGPFEVVAEYMNQHMEQPAGAPLSEPRRGSGWYVDVLYRFFPAGWRGKHLLLTEESSFAFVVRVEGIDLNHGTTGTTFRDDLTQLTLGFSFRPVERTVFKVSWTFVDSEDPAFSNADFLAMSWSSYF